MFFFVKHVRCAGCNTVRTYEGQGLRLKHDRKTNYKLLLACSSACAQKFIGLKGKPIDAAQDIDLEEDVVMTKNEPIPYRKITQTMDK